MRQIKGKSDRGNINSKTVTVCTGLYSDAKEAKGKRNVPFFFPQFLLFTTSTLDIYNTR